MHRLFFFIIFIFFFSISISKTDEDSFFSGGETTNIANNKNAFSLVAKNLEEYLKIDFLVGNALFERIWEDAQVSKNDTKDGLGPFFSASSCEQCHSGDGRGHLPDENFGDIDSISAVIQIGWAKKGKIELLKYIPDPVYGSQISEFSVKNVLKEADIIFKYDYKPEMFNNGIIVELRKPTILLKNLNYGKIGEDTKFSARIAQPIIGLGLIESISDLDILSNEDELDLNKDGISGKANRVWDIISNKETIGRFGWKASQPTVYQQIADAFFNDMGLSNTLHKNPSNCSTFQTICNQIPNGNSVEYNDLEVSNEQLDLITFYSKQLGVPARRNINDKDVIAGKKIFYELSCHSCHVEKFQTSNNAEYNNLKKQTIYPYSDFLLHEMGEGLADSLSEFLANGNEWRTPPLWGLGLTETVSGRQSYLHDGRARTITESILWHGGEAEEIKKDFLKLDVIQLNSILKFLESL